MEPSIQFEHEVPPRDTRQQWTARWADNRRRGRFFYVLRHGVVMQGGTFAALMMLARWFGMTGETHRDKPLLLLFEFLFYAFGFGLLAGFSSCHRNEKRFKLLTEATQIV